MNNIQKTDELLSLSDLRTHFRTPKGLVRAVDGVSFSLHRGETIGIVGESGSGKSVCARTIMGLLPSYAMVSAESSVIFDGQELIGLSEKKFRRIRGRDIAMIFQDPMTTLNPVIKIGKQISESLTLHLGMNAADARSRAIELLREVGIPQPDTRVDQYPHQLSGGMRQRVAIAIALSCEPKLLIADEPTTALDVTVQAEILDLLQREQKNRGMALILITHDLGVVAGRCDNVAVMYAGRIVERGPTGALFASPHMRYTQALLDSIPRLDTPPQSELRNIGGSPPNLIVPPPGCRFAPRCGEASENCSTQEPALTPAAGNTGHSFACWNPQL